MAVIDTVVITDGQFDAVARKLLERLAYEAFNMRHSPAGWVPSEEDVRAWCREILHAGDIRTQQELLKAAVVEVSGPEVAEHLFPTQETPLLPLSQETMTALASLTPVDELASTIPPKPEPEGPAEVTDVPRQGEAPRTLRVRLTGRETPDA